MKNETFKTILFIVGLVVFTIFAFVLGRCSRDDELDGILDKSEALQNRVLEDNRQLRENNTRDQERIRELQDELDSKTAADAEYYKRVDEQLTNLERNTKSARDLDKVLAELIRIAEEKAKMEKDQ